MKNRTLFSIVFLTVVSGCKDNSIKTYRLAKESSSSSSGAAPFSGMSAPFAQGESAIPSSQMPPQMDQNNSGAAPMGMVPGMAPAASSREIQWVVPKGWVEQAPSAMRVGSFLVSGENGQKADVSIIPLSGMAGGDLSNVNRWRDQIELAPISEQELSQKIEKLSVNGNQVKLVNFSSDKALIENKYKKRVLAAIYPQGERTWFFKMMGEDSTVQKALPSFKKFLESVKFVSN